MVLWRVFQSQTAVSEKLTAERVANATAVLEKPGVAVAAAATEEEEREDPDDEDEEHTSAVEGSAEGRRQGATGGTEERGDEDWDWVFLGEAASLSNPKGALVIDDYFTGDDLTPPEGARGPSFSDGAGGTETTASDDEFVDLEVARAPSTDTSERDKGAQAENDSDDNDDDEDEPSSPGPSHQEPELSAGSGGSGEAFDPPPRAAAVATAIPDEQPEKKNSVDTDPVYQCISCSNPILKASEIVSSSYRAMTGPGYLTSAARNLSISEETQEAVYTSGKYTVREVSCERCAAMLGITYVGAACIWNKHKVGKFLLGQNLLQKVER